MNNGQIAVLQTATETLTNPINLSGPLNGIAFDQSGQRLYVSSMSGKYLSLTPRPARSSNSRTVGGKGQEVVVSPDGSELYVRTRRVGSHVLDTSTLNSKARVTVPEAFGMSLSPDGSKLWVSCTRIGVVFVLDRVTRTLVDGFYVTGLPRRIAFTSSGKALVANEGGWARCPPTVNPRDISLRRRLATLLALSLTTSCNTSPGPRGPAKIEAVIGTTSQAAHVGAAVPFHLR